MGRATVIRCGAGAGTASLFGLFTLLVAASCGRYSKDDTVPANPAGAAGSAGSSSVSEAAGGGLATSGVAGEGGTGPTIVNVDPEISLAWQWQACGSIQAQRLSAVQVALPAQQAAIAILYEDGSVVLHPTAGADTPTVVRPPDSPAQGMAFSPDGKRLATVANGVVELRAVDGSAAPRTLTSSPDCTGSTLRFSNEGDRVLSWDHSSLCVWDAESGNVLRQLPGDFSSAALAGDQLITAEYGTPPVLRRWPMAELGSSVIALELPPDTTFTPDEDSLTPGLVVSPRADTVAALTQSADLAVGLWSLDDSSSAPRVAQFPNRFAEGPAYSASGALLSTGEQLVDVATLRALYDLANLRAGTASAIDDTGQYMALTLAVGRTETAAQLVALTGKTTPRLFGSLPSTAFISDLAVSPDGSRLALASPYAGLLVSIAADFNDSHAIAAPSVSLPSDLQFTADNQALVMSGDGWGAFDPFDGKQQEDKDIPPNPAVLFLDCTRTVSRVSPRGTYVSTGANAPSLNIARWADLGQTKTLETARCNARSRFSADESVLVTSGPELYRTADWSLVWKGANAIPMTDATDGDATDLYQDVQFVPGQPTVLSSHCQGYTDAQCSYSLLSQESGQTISALPDLHARRASISAEGHWVIAGGTALHLPSGQTRTIDAKASLSVFTSNGDIIALTEDNTLVRYCRQP